MFRGNECFLCKPDPALIWRTSPHFFAMVGLGPVVPGYSLIATDRHIESMFDIPDAWVAELEDFTASARETIEREFAPAVITEHGRVGLCHDRLEAEGHCYHAHQLVFPLAVDVIAAVEQVSEIPPISCKAFSEARRRGSHLVEYLYADDSEGEVVVGTAPPYLPRQFFRGVAANVVGDPDLSRWQDHPRAGVMLASADLLRSRL